MTDHPAFTHGNNLPSEADLAFLAEAGQNLADLEARVTIVDELRRPRKSQPRRLWPVTITHWVPAHSPDQARFYAEHMTRGGFGHRSGFTIDKVGEPRA